MHFIVEGGRGVISGLHHYGLEVPDLGQAAGFLEDFGLETGEKDGALVARCPGREQEQVRMSEAPEKRLHHVSFTLAPGSADGIRESLQRRAIAEIEPQGAGEDGLWIRDPDGTAIQLLDVPQACRARWSPCWQTWAATTSGSVCRSGRRRSRT
jgi:hypothetical protein